ncbi:MAG TPA: branched-chain amino acid ABC transporter substrate-binding protein [Albitalea sp.]
MKPVARRNLFWVAVTLTLSGASLAQEATIRIGHVAPTSGWMAVVGQESENGARMAIDALNERGTSLGGQKVRFELVAEDDAADPAKAVTMAQKLLAAGVKGVVGHLTSGTTIAASKFYSEAGIPQISPSATSPAFTEQGHKTAFRVIASDSVVGGALGRYAITELKATRFAVINDGSPYGQGLAEQFSQAVTAGGAKVVDAWHINDKAVDYADVLTPLKARRPELVFFGGMASQAGPMLAQMKALGIDARFMGGDGICTPDLATRASGAAADGQVVCASPGGVDRSDDPEAAKFMGAYARRFAADARFYAPYAYDAVMLMADAMVRAGSSDPAKFLPALAATRDFRGVTGPIAFGARGDVVNPALSIYTYKAQKKELVRLVR